MKIMQNCILGSIILLILLNHVNAEIDATITKDFFYDENMNPIVQIVVGNNAEISDVVVAGNIASAISSFIPGAATTYDGRVVMSASTRSSTGRYKRADNDLVVMNSNFYDEDDGLEFMSGKEKYSRGEFIHYNLDGCEGSKTVSANVMRKEKYYNVHCLFCYTYCLEELKNPKHTMKESITIDSDKMRWYESGIGNDDPESLILELDKGAIKYNLDVGKIPMQIFFNSDGEVIDFEWRGNILLFGDDGYYVKEIEGKDKMYIAKGKLLEDISSEGYTAEYKGYKFKIDHLIYAEEFRIAGITLDVQKPDGTVVQTQVSRMLNAIVDNLEIAGMTADNSGEISTASIIVYDTSSEILLEDGEYIDFGDDDKWKVTFNIMEKESTGWSSSMSIDEYEDVREGAYALKSIDIEYDRKLKLKEDEVIEFPLGNYIFKFKGFLTSDYKRSSSSGQDEGDINLEKFDKYKLRISFTDKNGNRHDNVGLYDGPFVKKDVFIMDGHVYEISSIIDSGSGSKKKKMVTFKDLIEGDKITKFLKPFTGSDFDLTTVPFESKDENEDTIDVDLESSKAKTDTFSGKFSGNTYLLYTQDNELYLMNGDSDHKIEVDGDVIGTLSVFDVNDNPIEISVINEKGTDINNDSDTDDVIVVIKTEGKSSRYNYAYVDLSDRDASEDEWEYGESVKLSVKGINASTPLTKEDVAARIVDEDDEILIMPESGSILEVDFGVDNDIESVVIKHPKDIVYPTYFIGTRENVESLEGVVITGEDEGNTTKIGCCSLLINEFSIFDSSNSKANVPRDMVVFEDTKDQTKNLIIIGGRSVNDLCAVETDRIRNATDKYVVERDGNKLFIAGLEAEDTIKAGNELIDWLEENIWY